MMTKAELQNNNNNNGKKKTTTTWTHINGMGRQCSDMERFRES